MKTFLIDCAGVEGEADFWERYVSVVEPESAYLFGRNLDAFWDAVESAGPGWPGACELRFINVQALDTLRDGAFLKALRRIADETTRIRIVLA